MKVLLKNIERDASIQCRAEIDVAVVNEYSDQMTKGAVFPPVELFGTAAKCWIGDGWHRVQAVESNRKDEIEATLHPGGRVDALRHALSANAAHGRRRSNADKRRCVEVALGEFPKLSSNAISKMCGVSDMLVASVRPQLQESGSSDREMRVGADGKERPAHRQATKPSEPKVEVPEVPEESEREVSVPPSQADSGEQAQNVKGKDGVDEGVGMDDVSVEVEDREVRAEQNKSVKEALAQIEQVRSLLETTKKTYGISPKNKKRLQEAVLGIVAVITRE
jgi:hypothetical protein